MVARLSILMPLILPMKITQIVILFYVYCADIVVVVVIVIGVRWILSQKGSHSLFEFFVYVISKKKIPCHHYVHIFIFYLKITYFRNRHKLHQHDEFTSWRFLVNVVNCFVLALFLFSREKKLNKDEFSISYRTWI